MSDFEQKAKNRKKYGKTSRDGGNFYGHSEDELGERFMHQGLDQKRLEHDDLQENEPFLDDSAAASRVDAMLNSYSGAETSMFDGGTFGNHFSIETSVQKALMPPTPKIMTGVQSQLSDSSTWPTIPNTAPVKSTTSEHIATMSSGNSDSHVIVHEGSKVDHNQTASQPRSSSQLVASTTPTSNNTNDADIQDELSMPPPTTSRRKPSMTIAKQALDYSVAPDELGSDDPAIGLPKDEYQPRPSRSRGNQNEDELMIPKNFSKRPEAVAKGKRKLKSRRKTTALAKPSPKVEISDDDEDEVRLPLVAVPKLSPTPNAHVPEYHSNPSWESNDKQINCMVDKVDHQIDKMQHENLPMDHNPSPKKRGRGRPKKHAVEPADDLQASDAAKIDELDKDDDSTDNEVSTKSPQTQRGPKRLKTAKDKASFQDQHHQTPGDGPQGDLLADVVLGLPRTTPSEDEHDTDLSAMQEPPPEVPKKRGRKKKADTDTAADSDHDEALTDATELTSKPEPKQRGRKKKQKLGEGTTPVDGDHDDELTEVAPAPTKRGRKAVDPPPVDAAPVILSDHDADDADSGFEKHNDAVSKVLSQSNSNENATRHSIKPPEENIRSKLTTPPTTPPKTATKPVHSPITSSKVKFRVGLSKKARIAPLLRIVRK